MSGYDHGMADTPGQNIPVPDPSALTTEQLRRELGSLREIIDVRLNAMDQATQLVAGGLVQFETQKTHDHARMDETRDRALAGLREYLLGQIDHVRAVHEEMFRGIDVRFAERDLRIQQAAEEARVSLDAALAAAKEAVSEQNKANSLAIGKSEAGVKERLDALVLLMNTSNTALSEKITSVTGRLDRIEAGSQAKTALWAAIVAVVLLVIAGAGLLLNTR